jgi:hypothetical protein
MFYSMPSSGYASSINSGLAQADASNARAEAREAKTETELLRHDVDRLLMITEALWTFLKKEHGYSDEDLANAVKEIDLRDGRLDGRAEQPQASPCPNCGRINSARRSLCIYCGQPLPVTLFAS